MPESEFEAKIKAVADEIRLKTGGTECLTLDNMATSVRSIDNSPATPSVTADILYSSTSWPGSTITLAGSVDNYDVVDVCYQTYMYSMKGSSRIYIQPGGRLNAGYCLDVGYSYRSSTDETTNPSDIVSRTIYNTGFFLWGSTLVPTISGVGFKRSVMTETYTSLTPKLSEVKLTDSAAVSDWENLYPHMVIGYKFNR